MRAPLAAATATTFSANSAAPLSRKKPLEVADQSLQVEVSAGIARAPTDSRHAKELALLLFWDTHDLQGRYEANSAGRVVGVLAFGKIVGDLVFGLEAAHDPSLGVVTSGMRISAWPEINWLLIVPIARIPE